MMSLLDFSDRVIGFNGSIEHSFQVNHLLGLFLKLFRNMNLCDLDIHFNNLKDLSLDDMVNLIVLWFHTRATRNIGKGEKYIFYKMCSKIKELIGVEPILATLFLVPHYGYYKDLCQIFKMNIDKRINEQIVSIYSQQLFKDFEDMSKGKRISLASKYAPVEKGKFHDFARILAESMFSESDCYKKYRELRVKLNKYINNLESVNTNYNKFHGPELFPYQIVNNCIKTCTEYDKTVLQKQWDRMKNNIDSCPLGNSVSMIDMSVDEKLQSVGISLGILVSELCNSDEIFIFSNDVNKIQFQKNECIVDKVQKVYSYVNNNNSSDIYKAVEHILPINPDILFIFSDMQFCVSSDYVHPWYTPFEILNKTFLLPSIVFWNLNSNTNGYQTSYADNNVQEVCGYSPCFFKYIKAYQVINNVIIPEEKNKKNKDIMYDVLNDKAFDPIRHALSDIQDGIFKDYIFDDEYVIV